MLMTTFRLVPLDKQQIDGRRPQDQKATTKRIIIKKNKNIIDVKDPSLEVLENFERFIVFEIKIF